MQKTIKRGELFNGKLDAVFLGYPGNYTLVAEGERSPVGISWERNPGRIGGPGITVSPPLDKRDLLLYVNNQLVTQPQQLRTGDICEVRQMEEKKSGVEKPGLKDSRDDFEPADETEQLRGELRMANQTTATMLKTEKKLNGELKTVKVALKKVSINYVEQSKLAETRLKEQKHLIAKLEEMHNQPPLLVNRVTGGGPYIDVGREPDKEGRRCYYRGIDSNTSGKKTQLTFLAYPTTFAPQVDNQVPVYCTSRVAKLMLASAGLGASLTFLVDTLLYYCL